MCHTLPYYHAHASNLGDSAADYNIENKMMTLIWAFGQVYPEYNHLFLSHAEFSITQNQLFFPIDELKYHGSINRGVTTINFFNAETGMITLLTLNVILCML